MQNVSQKTLTCGELNALPTSEAVSVLGVEGGSGDVSMVNGVA